MASQKLELIEDEMQGTTLSNGPMTNDKIFELLFNEEDLTWQTLLYELVKTNKMDPWDIDISVLSKSFIEMIKKLKELDFRISGKVVLASAILLKMKSNRFMLEDISAFDHLLYSSDDMQEEYLDDADSFVEMVQTIGDNKENIMPKLFPRTPQPRQRKVSIFDLVKALEKALEVKNRRITKDDGAPQVSAPRNYRDISLVIKDVYDNVQRFFKTQKSLTFSQLLPSDEKDDKIMTFIPLLHLRNQHKVDLHQEMHFGEIDIELLKDATPELEAVEQ